MTTGLPPMCACSTFAIGVCTDCRTPVCAEHSNRYSEQLVCMQHYWARWEADDPTFAEQRRRFVERGTRTPEATRQLVQDHGQRVAAWLTTCLAQLDHGTAVPLYDLAIRKSARRWAARPIARGWDVGGGPQARGFGDSLLVLTTVGGAHVAKDSSSAPRRLYISTSAMAPQDIRGEDLGRIAAFVADRLGSAAPPPPPDFER